MNIFIRILGIAAIGLGVFASIEMDRAKAAAGRAAPSTQEAVFAIISITLIFGGTIVAIFGRAPCFVIARTEQRRARKPGRQAKKMIRPNADLIEVIPFQNTNCRVAALGSGIIDVNGLN